MNTSKYAETMGKAARLASQTLLTADTETKNNALLTTATAIDQARTQIQAANQKDLEKAEKNGLSGALLDRLALPATGVDKIIESLLQVAKLDDPIGSIEQLKYQPSGIQVGKMRVPLGVIGIIYESRPNVTLEAASLCLKSGNAAILRGGSEAFHSNQVLAKCIFEGLKQNGLPETGIQVVNSTDRAVVGALISMPEYIDVIIPRGGKSLTERISVEATVPVIKHLDGVCHLFIDKNADIQQAIDVSINAKTQRYGTCNTMETLLVDESVIQQVIPEIFTQLTAKSVKIKACEKTIEFGNQVKNIDIVAATEDDWSTEYLAPILAVKAVSSLDEAIQHINQYGSAHTDSIITKDYITAQKFLRAVDSSSVMVNTSTRFADGFEYGLGAEIGISTNKLHARGPVGLEGLTTEKYVVLGNGHIRQ